MKPLDPNPSVPVGGQTILIGVLGISENWHFFDDNIKGRDTALRWMQSTSSPVRLFRVLIEDPEELVVTPPVPAKLTEKPVP